MRLCLLPLLSLGLSACVSTIARTAVDIVTLPVKVVSKTVDLATTSQAEADQNRGRELRKADEQRARDERLTAERCRDNRPLPTDVCRTAAPR